MKSTVFKTQIGQRFEDEHRDYTIIHQRRGKLKSNPQYTQRQVEIFCNKCGQTNWMAEERVLPPKNCACNKCRYAPKPGDSIVEKDEWMIPFFPGGREEAGRYTHGQGKKIRFICPYCGKQRSKGMAISTLYRTHSIGCSCPWSGGRSFPERLFKGLIDYCGVIYVQEASGKDLDWNPGYYYDFFFPMQNVMVELHGLQHYQETTLSKLSGKYLEDIKKEDEAKRKLALGHGIREDHYFEIDCRVSSPVFISANISDSGLPYVLNLDMEHINWDEITQNAWKSEKLAIRKFCEENPGQPVRSIAEIFGVSRDMVKEVEVISGIYDARWELKKGVERQRELFLRRREPEVQMILRYKREHPSATTEDIGQSVGHSRAYIRKILTENDVYDNEYEKKNKYENISKARKQKRDAQAPLICQYRMENSNISAREVGRLTGHTHGHVIKVWRENGLYHKRMGEKNSSERSTK